MSSSATSVTRPLLLALLISSAASAVEPLKISVYATAGGIQQLLATPDGLQRAAAAMRKLGVTRVILEGRRGDEYVSPETLKRLRADLAALGFETSGGIATVPGKKFAVRNQGALSWLNWESLATRNDIAAFFSSNAPVFDELVIDDFYCTMDTSPESDRARAGRDWGDYRRDLLSSLLPPIVVQPARAANSRVQLTIKYPQWYDRFHLYGYDPARMSPFFDRVWVGTEVRNPKTQRMGFVQPTQGYINFRWLSSLIGPKVEAAWFDHIECTAENFVDQAWQSVLAGARELVLFNLIDVVNGHPGHAPFIQALPAMRQAAARIQGKPLQGVAYYKPPNSDPGDNRFLMDYLAMLGIPIVPAAAYPSTSKAAIFGLQAASDPDLLSKVQVHLKRGARIAFTASLAEKIPPPPGVARLDLRTFSEQDYRDAGEWLLPPKELPWFDMSRPQVDALRKTLGVELSAPAGVGYYILGNHQALYNFCSEDASVRIRDRKVVVPAHSLVWARP